MHAVRRDGLPRTDRTVRGDDDVRQDPRADAPAGRRGADRDRRGRRGNAPAARGWPREGQERADLDGRGFAGDRQRLIASIPEGRRKEIPPNCRYRQDMNLDFAEVLLEVMDRRASDLHLTAGAPPMIRARGRLVPMEGYPVLTPTDTRDIVDSILSNAQRQRFENSWQIDFASQIPGKARFRVNAYFQRSAVGAAFRLIPFEVVPFDSLGLPPVVAAFAKRPRGLVLVTGPTGSGKSTTLASLIDIINSTREQHIMTIEDPIEFLHQHKKCVVNQRELGSDATSFGNALKAALRQDPDVILVGEMRDIETISTAVTAAETGHLVFATLHTQDAPQTIDRIIDVF